MPTIEIDVTPMRYWREKAGLTQVEAAERAGISTTYWSDIENNKRSPSLEKARRVAAAMGKHVDDVFPPGGEESLYGPSSPAAVVIPRDAVMAVAEEMIDEALRLEQHWAESNDPNIKNRLYGRAHALREYATRLKKACAV